MGKEDQAVLLEKKATLLQQFLQLTKKVSGLLNGEMEQERFVEVETCLKGRAALIDQMTALGPVIPSAMDDAAKKQEWLCNQLLGQIQVIEEKNVAAMNGILDQYKEKMRTKQQDRVTVGAYSKQMEDADFGEEGSVLDRLK